MDTIIPKLSKSQFMKHVQNLAINQGLSAKEVFTFIKGQLNREEFFLSEDINFELQVIDNAIQRAKRKLKQESKTLSVGTGTPEINQGTLQEVYDKEKLKEQVEQQRFEVEQNNIFGKEMVTEVFKRLKAIGVEVTSKDQVLALIKEIDSDNKEFEEFNSACTTNDRYKVTPTHYIFYKRIEDIYGDTTIKEYPVKRSLVEKIYKDYSEHGLKNLSGQEIRQKYKLRPETFELLKNVLSLYKASNVLPDDVLKGLSTEQVEERIEEVIEEGIQDKYINAYQKVHAKKMKQYTEKALNRLGVQDYLVNYITEKLNEYTPRPYIPATTSKEVTGVNKANDYCVVGFGDIHKGLKVKADGYGLRTDKDIISQRIREIGANVAKRSESHVHLIMNGDLFEAMQTALMHTGQHLEMDLFGADQFTGLLDDIEQMLMDILVSGKTVSLRIKRGNHDRADKNHDDKLGTFATIFGVTLSRSMKEYINNKVLSVDYSNEDVSCDLIGKINYISYHGDILRTSAELNKVVMRYGYTQRDWIFNVVIVSHLHTNTVEEGVNSVRVKLSSLATANGFAEGFLGNSLPGYTVFTENSIGLPEFEFKRFSV